MAMLQACAKFLPATRHLKINSMNYAAASWIDGTNVAWLWQF